MHANGVTERRRPLRNAILAGAVGMGLAAGTLWLAGGGGSPAAAQGPSAGGGFTLSIQQLRINQRISSAAVRRSNESLGLLDPIRPIEGLPDKVLGWGTTSLLDGAVTGPKIGDGAVGTDKIGDGSVTGPKIADGAVTEPKLASGVSERLALWAVVAADGSLARNRGATASSIIAGPSFYRVDFNRPVRTCSFGATLGSTGQIYVGPGEVSVFGHPVEPAAVVVVTHNSAGGLLARPFHLTVNC